jgi:hypothetical protein
LPGGTKRSGSNPPERSSSYSRKNPSVEQRLRDELVAARGHPGRLEVAAAQVRGDRHVSGTPRHRRVGERDVPLVHVLCVLAALGYVRALRRVVHVGQGRVVELEVAAALRGEAPHLLVVGRTEVGPELLHFRVHVLVHDGPDARAVVDHRRRRDRELGHGIAGDGLQEREVLAEDRLVHAQPAGHLDRVRRVGDVALLIVEGGQQRAWHLGDAADLVDEVHVPGGAAELAVGHRPQPRLPLQRDHLADRVVLDRAQLPGGDLAFRPPPARLVQPGRP